MMPRWNIVTGVSWNIVLSNMVLDIYILKFFIEYIGFFLMMHWCVMEIVSLVIYQGLLAFWKKLNS